MNYGGVIRDAWAITWRHRFLWLLALFAGGAAWGGGNGGQGVQWQTNEGEAAAATGWIAANPGPVVVGLAALVVLVILLLIGVGLIAQGGLVTAISDLAAGRPSSLGAAWRAGRRLLRRYAGLWLLLLGLVIVVAAIVGSLAAALIGTLAMTGGTLPGWQTVAAALLVGLPLAASGLLAAILVGIVVTYAQRAIAIDDLGPLAALRAGWRLLRAWPGRSLLAWLIGLGLSLGAGLTVALASVAVAGIVGGAVALLWLAGGFTTPTMLIIGLGGFTFVVAILILAGLSNTFFWTYWTLVYLRLAEGGEGATAARPAGPVAPPQPQQAAS